MHAWRVGWLLIAVGLGGCATPIVDVTPSFKEDDFRWVASPGTATLNGQAFARTRRSELYSCAGLEIYLVPVTPYTKAISEAMEDSVSRFAPHPPEYFKYRRTTIGDASGGFEFRDLPAGQWYVGCGVRSFYACQWGRCEYSIVHIERMVETREGQAQRVIVTPGGVSVDEFLRRKPKCEYPPIWC